MSFAARSSAEISALGRAAAGGAEGFVADEMLNRSFDLTPSRKRQSPYRIVVMSLDEHGIWSDHECDEL